jgi:hypothetical protein
MESPDFSEDSTSVAPSDIISNLFLEDLEKIWELKKWIPDPCNPYLHHLKQDDEEDNQPEKTGDNSSWGTKPIFSLSPLTFVSGSWHLRA